MVASAVTGGSTFCECGTKVRAGSGVVAANRSALVCCVTRHTSVVAKHSLLVTWWRGELRRKIMLAIFFSGWALCFRRGVLDNELRGSEIANDGERIVRGWIVDSRAVGGHRSWRQWSREGTWARTSHRGSHDQCPVSELTATSACRVTTLNG